MFKKLKEKVQFSIILAQCSSWDHEVVNGGHVENQGGAVDCLKDQIKQIHHQRELTMNIHLIELINTFDATGPTGGTRSL